jgi:hypothetical protein
MRRQLLQLCLPWPRLPRHGCFLSVSWASNQPRECRGEPRDEISVQSANYLPDIRLLSTANPFKSLLLMQKCVLLASVTPKPERARALKKRLFWMSITRYGSRGVATGVSDAPPGAFSTHGLQWTMYNGPVHGFVVYSGVWPWAWTVHGGPIERP